MLVYRNTKNAKDLFQANSRLYEKKKQRVVVINHDYLCSEYQRAKMIGIGLAPAGFSTAEHEKLNFLILGTGAGLLTMFIQSQLHDHINKLDTIDNNPVMLKIAEQQFGFKMEKFGKSHTGDAINYIHGL